MCTHIKITLKYKYKQILTKDILKIKLGFLPQNSEKLSQLSKVHAVKLISYKQDTEVK